MTLLHLDTQEGLPGRRRLFSRLVTGRSARTPAKRAGAQRLRALARLCRTRSSPELSAHWGEAGVRLDPSDRPNLAWLTLSGPTGPLIEVDRLRGTQGIDVVGIPLMALGGRTHRPG